MIPVIRGRRAWRNARWLAEALSVLVLSACASERKPALPKHAVMDVAADAGEAENYSALVDRADILYFPVEHLADSARDSSLKLLTAMQNAAECAVAWDLIDGDGQQLLDRWSQRQLSTEELIAQLHLGGTETERENCRAILRGSASDRVRHFALRCPDRILAKLRHAGEPGATEDPELPSGFTIANGDYELFAAQLPRAHGVAENELRNLYRAYVVSEQFAAERIVMHLSDHPRSKVLVFVHRRYLDSTRGVPQFVAQKTRRRQVVLEPKPSSASSRTNLLASISQFRGGLVQVVNRAPAPAVY
ncbi:MAG TPA: ChaN family lipoprotein [Chthoniobacterales bacterium]|nr:ChaN family lipoprotein [Chthoniobacterales bacterium]